MSFDNTKYHCEINSVPYTIRSYQKTELSTFIPRLGAGDQSESAFDLLRSKTVQGFEGGSLQRYLTDETSVFATEGLYPIYEDGTLYPVNAPSTLSGLIGSTKAAMTAYVVTKDYVFIASRTLTSPVNSIRRIDTSGTSTTLTIPNSLRDSTAISSMVIYNNQLWIATGTTSMWYMALSATTVTDITGGTNGYLIELVVFKGSLYGTGADNASLDRYTGTTSSKAFVTVGDTAKQDDDPNARLLIFNNRIFLLRQDGMYAYDGTLLVTIEDASDNINARNYRFPVVLKGYLYYFMPDGWYRFNGSLIEKLYDISEIGFPKDVFTGKNRIWFVYANSSNGSSRYDKSMGYDYSSGTNVDGRLMVFNGKGLYTYARTSTWVKNTGTEDFAGQGEVLNGFYFNDDIFILENYEKTTGNEYYKIDLDELAATGNKSWRMVTSIDDSDFPMVDKNQENIEIVLDGYISSDQTIIAEYRSGGFDGSTGWTNIGSIFTQTHLKEYIWRNTPAGITFRQIQFRLSGTTAAGYGIKQFVSRYLIVPDYKNQWTLTALCYGDDALAPLQLADDTDGSQQVQTLRGNIYTARNSNIPIKFIDVDQLDLNGAINNSVTSVVVNNTALLKGDDGFIQIDDEIIYWYAKTSTTLTVIRAMLGSSAASHSDNAKVFIVYRVIVRQIQNERIELDKPENTSEDKSRSSEITLTLQEV